MFKLGGSLTKENEVAEASVREALTTHFFSKKSFLSIWSGSLTRENRVAGESARRVVFFNLWKWINTSSNIKFSCVFIHESLVFARHEPKSVLGKHSGGTGPAHRFVACPQ